MKPNAFSYVMAAVRVAARVSANSGANGEVHKTYPVGNRVAACVMVAVPAAKTAPAPKGQVSLGAEEFCSALPNQPLPRKGRGFLQR